VRLRSMFCNISSFKFWFAIDFTSCDQSSTFVAFDFIEIVLDLTSSPLYDLVFLRNESIKFLVEFSYFCGSVCCRGSDYSFLKKSFAKGSIFNNLVVASLSASSILVSTTTYLVLYSTNRLRWLSLAVLDQRSGKVLSSDNKCFFLISFLCCFALRFIYWTNSSTMALFSR